MPPDRLALNLSAAIGHYDALRLPITLLHEHEARETAVAYLLKRDPALEELEAAVILADALARRATNRSGGIANA
jgi:hypothetical protein